MLRNGVRNEAEDADRSVVHDNVREADHHVARELKDLEQGLAAFTEAGKAAAEEDGEHNDLEHAALRHGFNRVDRDEVEERLNNARGLHNLSDSTGGGKVKAEARVDDLSNTETEGHSDSGRDHVAEKNLHSYAAELGNIGDAGSASDEGREDERNNHHSDQSNKQVAKRLEPSGAYVSRNKRAHDDTDHEADTHLDRQT